MGKGRVYLIDDEDAVRKSLQLLLRTAGWKAEPFASGDEFLAAAQGLEPACTLLDVRMPGTDGLEVQQELLRRGIALPVIMMTGHGDIAVAVAALQSGAIDFVEKPFERRRLIEALDQAALMIDDPEGFGTLCGQAAEDVGRLSRDDREILDCFMQGLSNQAASSAVSRSISEVELARARIVDRLGGQSLADAIRTAYLAKRSGDTDPAIV